MVTNLMVPRVAVVAAGVVGFELGTHEFHRHDGGYCTFSTTAW
jgi:hypothetical protein